MRCVCICVFGGVGGRRSWYTVLLAWYLLWSSGWLQPWSVLSQPQSSGNYRHELPLLASLRIIPLPKKIDESLKAPDYFSKFYLTVPQENRENLRTNQPTKVLWKYIKVLKFIRPGTLSGARQMTYLINITELALPELNNHLYLLKTK